MELLQKGWEVIWIANKWESLIVGHKNSLSQTNEQIPATVEFSETRDR